MPDLFLRRRKNGRSIMFDFELDVVHLFINEKNISPSSLSQCGKVKCNYHIFFECRRYVDSKACLLYSISTICSATLQTLLNGDPNISADAMRRLLFIPKSEIAEAYVQQLTSSVYFIFKSSNYPNDSHFTYFSFSVFPKVSPLLYILLSFFFYSM
jgi:hypothetical protein